MKKNAQLHARVAGQVSRGPFKHYWGEASRYVGNDNPYSLFLASGVPFEVTDTLNDDGWTFLAEYDAKALSTGKLKAGHGSFIHNVKDLRSGKELIYLPETLDDVFQLKRNILPELAQIPYVVEDVDNEFKISQTDGQYTTSGAGR